MGFLTILICHLVHSVWLFMHKNKALPVLGIRNPVKKIILVPRKCTHDFFEKLSQIPNGGADMSLDHRQALVREFLVLQQQQAHQRGHSTAELGQGDIRGELYNTIKWRVISVVSFIQIL